MFQRGNAGPVGVVVDGRRLRDRVRVDGEDAGEGAEATLDDDLLGGVLERHSTLQDDRLAISG